MATTYVELFYHLVWTTKYRGAVITAEVEPHLYRYIRHKCEELGVLVHALGGVADHVHLAVSLPPLLAVADFVRLVKGSSSHFVNHLPGRELGLVWQAGYGALTFAKRDLPVVVAYITQQKQHHAAGMLRPGLERSGDDEVGSPTTG